MVCSVPWLRRGDRAGTAAWWLLTSSDGVGQGGGVGVTAARQLGDGLAAASPGRDPQLLHLGGAPWLRHSLRGAEVALLHPVRLLQPTLAQTRGRGTMLVPAGARSRCTGVCAGSPGPGRCGCPSATPAAGSSCAAGSRGTPPHGSHLWGGVSAGHLRVLGEHTGAGEGDRCSPLCVSMEKGCVGLEPPSRLYSRLSGG